MSKEKEIERLIEEGIIKPEPGKPFAGITFSPYKFGGKSRCESEEENGARCCQPAYSEALCYYHEKVRKGQIEPEKRE